MSPRTKRLLLRFFLIVTAGYLLICCLAYFLQEKLIFYPEKLPDDYRFRFPAAHEELQFTMADGVQLHGVLFKADSSRRLIFYLHGNAGSLAGWGEAADFYTASGYDVFMLDYRGYGKSEGKINGQQRFFDDVQSVYDSLSARYAVRETIILGYSIGTGAATWLAAHNDARMLILQAPYYSLTDMMQHYYPVLPTFVLKYRFETFRFLPQCKMPVTIFHGDADEVIYYGSSQKLSTLFKPGDTLITLQEAGHNNLSDRPDYQEAFLQAVGKGQ
ncbi:alpha/beta hydrolase [Paraflavitalea pollutisoli]|uniref:alpha/beta hydrolase n=1 Tax=Paraflavitalea pollutisoli TaxID=3034143 RepID=UPI0023EBBF54|nr:alpha/beta hydrolase [Paraflavitalea sp. H1-2-19X]